jgi:hypothetical protein
MQAAFGAFGLIIALIWAFRIEINTARTSETLQRIEKLLEQQNKKEK